MMLQAPCVRGRRVAPALALELREAGDQQLPGRPPSPSRFKEELPRRCLGGCPSSAPVGCCHMRARPWEDVVFE